MSRGRDAYLFAKSADITDVVEHVREDLKRELELLDSEKILSTPVDDLVGKLVEDFRLNVPVLKRDAIHQLPNEEVDIDVSRDPNRIFTSPGPHHVKGTAIRIAIPFDGNPDLFKYPSSSFGVPIDGEVVGDTIVLTYRAEHPDSAAVKREFDGVLGKSRLRSTSCAVRRRNGTASFHTWCARVSRSEEPNSNATRK